MTDTVHAQARAYVQARLDDRLAAEHQAWLNAHLAGCDACRAYAAEHDRLARLLPETFQARWDASKPAPASSRRPAAPNPGAYVPIGGQSMLARHKLFNFAGVGLGLGALAILLIGFAFALQTATTTDSQIPGQGLDPTGPAALFTPPPMQVAAHVTFGDAIALEGYTVSPTDDGLSVSLIWHALAAPPADYMVGVFLMPDGAQSAIFGQSDSIPAAGTRPTIGWQPFEYIVDTHTLSIPTEMDANLVLWVNVYDPTTGERLPSDPPGGGPFNATPIGAVSVPANLPATGTPLPFPTEAVPVECTAGPCTPTPTPACEPNCPSEQEAQATADMAATLGWTATPVGFVPSVTPCQAGCEFLLGHRHRRRPVRRHRHAHAVRRRARHLHRPRRRHPRGHRRLLRRHRRRPDGSQRHHRPHQHSRRPGAHYCPRAPPIRPPRRHPNSYA